jgi:glycosyltransferase involved in cell wall biosynthesis
MPEVSVIIPVYNGEAMDGAHATEAGGDCVAV